MVGEWEIGNEERNIYAYFYTSTITSAVLF